MKSQKINKVLLAIAEKNGGKLLPEHVLDVAKNPKHILHKHFEWDDGEAAHQWRLNQARQLIRVCVEVVDEKIDPSPVFVSLRNDRKEGGYRVTTDVMNDTEMREQLLQDALAELNRFQRKYRAIRELAGVFAAFKKLKKAA